MNRTLLSEKRYEWKMLWMENVMNGKCFERKTLGTENVINRSNNEWKMFWNRNRYERKTLWTENVMNGKRYDKKHLEQKTFHTEHCMGNIKYNGPLVMRH